MTLNECFWVAEEPQNLIENVVGVFPELVEMVVIADDSGRDVQFDVLLRNLLHKKDEVVPLLGVHLLLFDLLHFNEVFFLFEKQLEDVMGELAHFLDEYFIVVEKGLDQDEQLEDGLGPAHVGDKDSKEVFVDGDDDLDVDLGMGDDIFEKLEVEGVEDVRFVETFFDLAQQGVQEQGHGHLVEFLEALGKIEEQIFSYSYIFVQFDQEKNKGLVDVRGVLALLVGEVLEQLEEAVEGVGLEHVALGADALLEEVGDLGLVLLVEFGVVVLPDDFDESYELNRFAFVL